jgi:hypothetical protein
MASPSEIDPTVSKYFSDLAKKRTHPYLPFKNKDYAKKMSRKAQQAREKKLHQTQAPDEAKISET